MKSIREIKVNKPTRQCGFTLLEVLIASALTAVAGLIAYSFVNSAISAYQVHSVKAARLDEINRFLIMFNRDLLHAVDRPIRDEHGDVQAAMMGELSGEYLLVLTRGGRPNPRQVPRSSLQRIAYFLNDETIERVAWRALDRVDGGDEALYKAPVLTGVEEVSIRFLQKIDVIIDNDKVTNNWQDSWPQTLDSQVSVQQAGLPVAVELNLRLHDWGELKRIYALSVEP